jgi:hypothetical protein
MWQEYKNTQYGIPVFYLIELRREEKQQTFSIL